MARYIDLSGQVRGLVREDVRAAVEGVALIVRDEVVAGMEDAPARTGKRYRIPGTSTYYTASAPHEKPAIREAAYRNSWQASPAVEEGGKVVAIAFSDLKTPDGRHVIGELLDMGTVHMAPREHIDEAVEKATQRAERFLRGFK